MLTVDCLAVLAGVWVICAAADSPSPIELWPAGQVPGERPGTFGPEVLVPIPDGGGPDDTQYENVTVPTLTPFLVSSHGGAPTGTAVIVAPGGGYSIVAWNREGLDICKWLNSISISCFLLKYRVPERSWLPFGAAPHMDAQRAMGLVRKRSAEFGLNSSRIGVMGFSAGGHLAGYLSTSFVRTYPRIDAADDESCRPDFSLLIYPWMLVNDSDITQLTVNITKETPPAFLAQAMDDDGAHVENSLKYYLGLKAASAPPSELHVYPVGGHGYGRCTVTRSVWQEVCTWPARAQMFLEVNVLRYLEPSAPLRHMMV